MTIPRKKIIIALIPFVVTTIAIIVFLIFFYWGEITFSGNSPFTVQYNGTQYPDTNGTVNIRSRAGSQTFIVTKDQYQPQTIEQDISWFAPNSHALRFVYQAKVNDIEPFTPSISYVNPISVSDNQLTDIIAAPEARKIALPAGINNVIWNRTGTQACLLHTGSGSMQNQLLTNTAGNFSAEPLGNQTFDCQSGPSGVRPINIDGKRANVDNKTIDLEQFPSWTLTASLYGDEVFIAAQKPDSTKKTIIYWNLATGISEEWGSWEMSGNIRIVGPQTVAIPLINETLLLYKNKQIFTLPSFVTLNSILFSASEETLYYIDIDRNLSFKNVFQTTQPPKQILQQSIGADKPTSIKILNDDQTLLTARLSPDQSQAWYLFDQPNTNLLKIDIAPGKS
jgi:hypothetical protein